MTSRPHLLFTAWGFPPSRAGGVYRALATVNAFAERGWDVTVLTTPRDTFLSSTGGDEALERRIHPGVQVERLPVATPAFSSDISDRSGWRARYPELWAAADWRRDIVHFPERAYGRWRPILEKTAARVHSQHPVSLTMGTANPHVDFISGWSLHRSASVPFVMDYRDAWRLDVFSGRTIHSASSRVGRWERRLQRQAAEVWFVNEPIARWHIHQDPSIEARTHIVSNGFDEYELPLRVPVRDVRTDGLRFGYIGTVSDNVPVRELLSGWRLARERSAVLRQAELVIHGYLGHFGASGSASEALAEYAGDGVKFAGPVSKATIGGIYKDFDVLVLALGSGRYVTSGKVFEYAATGIPIVSIHDPGNAATEVLRDSPSRDATASLSAADIATALMSASRRSLDETNADRFCAQEWGQQFERSKQLGVRIDALHESVVDRAERR